MSENDPPSEQFSEPTAPVLNLSHQAEEDPSQISTAAPISKEITEQQQSPTQNELEIKETDKEDEETKPEKPENLKTPDLQDDKKEDISVKSDWQDNKKDDISVKSDLPTNSGPVSNSNIDQIDDNDNDKTDDKLVLEETPKSPDSLNNPPDLSSEQPEKPTLETDSEPVSTSVVENQQEAAAQVLPPAKDSIPSGKPELQKDSKSSIYPSPSRPQPKPKTSTSSWSGLLKRAVANVESTLDRMESSLDKVISDSATSEIGPKPVDSEPAVKIASPKPVNVALSASSTSSSLSPSPSQTSSAGRLSLQERLAKSIKASSSTQSLAQTPTDSPRQSLDKSIASPKISIDSSRPSIETLESQPEQSELQASEDVSANEDTPEPITEIAPKSEPLASDILDSLNLGTLRSLVEEINHIDDTGSEPISLTDVKSKFSRFMEELKSREDTNNEELHSYKEKVTSLESKLVFLAREEADNAKNDKLNSTGIQKKLAEKEEQVALLIEEGQALSKKELKYMNTIKAIRAREKEQERVALEARDSQQRAERELKQLRERFQKLQDSEKRNTGDQRIRAKLENEVELLRRDKAAALAKIESLEDTVAVLQQRNTAEQTAAQTKALEAERSRVTALQRELTQAQLALTVSNDTHKSEIRELETRMKRDAASWERTQVKTEKEIRQLEAKVEMYRSRSEELSSGLGSGTGSGSNGGGAGGSATGPESSQLALLRQIEVMQTQHSIATENWNGIETNLQNRIASLEQQVEDSNARDLQFRKKIKALNESLKAQTAENENLADQIEELQDKLKVATTTGAEASSKLEEAQARVKELEDMLSDHKKSSDARLQKLEQELKESLDAANASATAAQQKLQMVQQQQQLQQQQQNWRGPQPAQGHLMGRHTSLDSANSDPLANSLTSSASSSQISLTLPRRGSGDVQSGLDDFGSNGLYINSGAANARSNPTMTNYLNGLTSPTPSPSTWGFGGPAGMKSPMMMRRSSKGSLHSNMTNPYESAHVGASGPMGISEVMYEENEEQSDEVNGGDQGQSDSASHPGRAASFVSVGDTSVELGETPSGFPNFEDSASTVGGSGGFRENESDRRDSASGAGGGGGGASIQLVGRMSRTIRILESELSSVKLELARAGAKEEAATREVLRLSAAQEDAEGNRARIQELESKIENMSKREKTALEMLGEKSEQVEELRADVEDLKTMYRTQIEDLIDQLIKAKSK